MTSSRKQLSREERAARIAGQGDRMAKRAVMVMLAVLALAGLALVVPYAWRAMTDQQGPDAAHDMLAKAQATLVAGNFSAAEDLAAKAAEADPKSAAVRVEHAGYALRIGAWKLAQAELDVAARLGFDATRLRATRAHAWQVRGDPAAALRELAGGSISPPDRRLALRVTAMARGALSDESADAAFTALLREAGDDPDAWIAHARYRDGAGDHGGAIAAIDRAVALAPAHVEAVTLRAILTREQYGLSAAMPWFDKAVSLDPRHIPAFIERAMTLADLGDADGARDALAAARKLRPNHPRLHLLEAAMDAQEGDFTAARLAFFRSDSATRTRANGLLLGGAVALNQDQPAEAARLLTMLLRQQPLNMTVRTLLARAWLETGDGTMAFRAISPVTERGDADPYALILAVRALEAMGENRAAFAYLDRAARLRRNSATPFVLAADVNGSKAAQSPVAPVRTFMATGKATDALDKVKALAAANPGVPEAHVALGDVLLATGDARAAASAFQRAANLTFNEGVMLRLVDAWLRAGQSAEAAKAVSLYLEQQPRSLTANALAGAAYLRAQNWAQAIETLEAARSAGGGNDVRVLTDLAYAYLGAGQGKLALPHARRAYALLPMNAETSNAYGLALIAVGHKGRGPADLLEKAIAIAPNVPRYRLHLGAAYAAQGRTADARALLELLQNTGDAALADSARQELARL